MSSADIDESKASIYAEAGIPEYWIVQPESRTVTVFLNPANLGYNTRTVFSDLDTLYCSTLTEVSLPIASVLPPKQ